MARKVVTCSVCLRKDLLEKVDKLTHKLDVSRSKAMSIILREYFEKEGNICRTKEESENAQL